MTNFTEKHAYRFPNTATIEELSMDHNSCYGSIARFGNTVLVTEQNYRGENVAAIYELPKGTGQYDIETSAKLTEIAEQTFEDSGHAMAWLLGKIA